MVPDPTALALLLCEQVIVDQYSRNPSPISIFTGLAVGQFPSDPQRFSVFAALTDTQGDGRLELRASRLDTGEEFYAQRFPGSLSGPRDRGERQHPRPEYPISRVRCV